MKPAEKSPEVEQFLDEFARDFFGRERSECIKNDICVTCGSEATKFNDELSKKEFSQSGMCQSCQDEIFNNHLNF